MWVNILFPAPLSLTYKDPCSSGSGSGCTPNRVELINPIRRGYTDLKGNLERITVKIC